MKNLIFLMEYDMLTGGMIQSVVSLIKGLSLLDYNISLVCMPESAISEIPFNNNVNVITTKRKKWYTQKNTPLKTFLTSFEIYLLIRKQLKDSVVISNDLGASFLISCFPTRAKEIFVCRGGRFTGVAGKLIKYKIKHSIYWTIATSTFQMNFIKQNCGAIDNVRVIHNGLKLPETDIPLPILTPDDLKISVVGYIAPDKNQAEGVKMIKKLRDRGINAYLNVFGTIECEVDELYDKELQLLIDKLDVRDYVYFHGFASQDDIYSKTDILISFSYAEGFGRTLVEAMFRNRPVIAYRGAGGPVDITDNGRVGHLVEANNAEEYANVIIKILEDPKKEYENIRKAKDYSLSHFTEDIMTERYDEFLKSI